MRTVVTFGPGMVIPSIHPRHGVLEGEVEYLSDGFARAWYKNDSEPPRQHDARDPLTNTCIYCYSKLKPGPQAVLVKDYDPSGRTTTTTGGV